MCFFMVKGLLLDALNQFHECPGVMIGAFPETGFGVGKHGLSVGTNAQEPFAAAGVYQLFADVVPKYFGLLQVAGVSTFLPGVGKAYHGFGLYPPVAVGFQMIRR